MPTEKWTAGTDRSTVLTTELNALADGSRSAVGTELDNSSNKDRYGIAELNVTFGTNPTAEAVLNLYAVLAPDGTNYGDGSATAAPSYAMFLGSFQVRAVTTAQRVHTAPFLMPGPFKMKFILENRAGFALPASGSTVSLRTFNRDIS